jgi:hypothetical protein
MGDKLLSRPDIKGGCPRQPRTRTQEVFLGESTDSASLGQPNVARRGCAREFERRRGD